MIRYKSVTLNLKKLKRIIYFSGVVILCLAQLPFNLVRASNFSFSEKQGGHSESLFSEQVEQWVVVLNDTRSERRKNARGVGYGLPRNYRNDLALKRIKKDFSEQYSLEVVADWPINSLSVYCLVVKLPDSILKPKHGANNLLKSIEKDPRVKWLQPLNQFEALSSTSHGQTSNDGITYDNSNLDELDHSQSDTQFSDPYFNLQSSFAELQLNQLAPQIDGRGVEVAIIDSGVDITHKDFQGASINYQDFVGTLGINSSEKNVSAEKHGTAVASLIVAQRNNAEGIAGIAPSVKLYAYRSCWENQKNKTICNTLTLSLALDKVFQVRPYLLNLSLSGPEDRLLEALIDKIISQGTKVVSAYDDKRGEHARFPKSRVGVYYARGILQKSIQGNYFLLPGKDIIAAQPENSYQFLSGNSLSSAHLTSVLALLKQIGAGLSDELLAFDLYAEKKNRLKL
ncbi:MAG: S8 family serine peptidase, partial [Kangiellaceae bacterium]|nr:S8 family serine peptidase [Kangiellaceae bacterium]